MSTFSLVGTPSQIEEEIRALYDADFCLPLIPERLENLQFQFDFELTKTNLRFLGASLLTEGVVCVDCKRFCNQQCQLSNPNRVNYATR